MTVWPLLALVSGLLAEPDARRNAGVPVRIVVQGVHPRWWLKVELTLDLSRLDAEPGPAAKRLTLPVKVPENSARTRLHAGQASVRGN